MPLSARLLTLFIFLVAFIADAGAVLKEKDLEQTLVVLYAELSARNQELNDENALRKEQNETLINDLVETMKLANQNALMLYSQHQDYVFDLTYACHQATEQYRQFTRKQLPFRQFIDKTDAEIAKYDSLVISLKQLPQNTLSAKARSSCNGCLRLATDIRKTLDENRSQMAEYMGYYNHTGQRLKALNDYAQKRYNDIQSSIFSNGGESYFSLLRHLGSHWSKVWEDLRKKYIDNNNENSQWNSTWIYGLFVVMLFYVIVAVALNLLVFRYLLPKRFRTERFQRKRTPIIMTTTVVTFAVCMGLLPTLADQNFLAMASDMLVEFAWLISVILISLLLRLDAGQIGSAFRIYAPLLVVGFAIIVFRIVLIPSTLVNLLFPAMLLISTLWQWWVIRRHNQLIPRSDIIYSYLSLFVLAGATGCAFIGYTLFAVQVLIWWIMQLTCVLTITCISLYVTGYGKRHGFDQKPITKTWAYRLLHSVVLPTLSVFSVMYSIYWAAGVFNMSDLCLRMFNTPFINLENLQVSIKMLTIVICLWFLFRYIANTVLDLLRMSYRAQDESTAASREVMGKNVIQVLVWGVWLLLSLSLLHVSVTWLVAISGGLSTGIGFASKDIIENIYYGASLMAGRIKVGDWIQVDDTMGRVTSISYTSTIVEALTGEVVTYKNAQLLAKNYKNLTKNHGYVLAIIPFSVAYGSDLNQVTTLVENAVNQLHHPMFDPERPAKTVVTEMGDSSINFRLFVWTEAPKRSYVVSDVLKCVYDTLNKNGITIPFPQRDVHIIN